MKNFKLLALVLAVIMLFTVCALGSGSDDSSASVEKTGENGDTTAAKQEGPIKVNVGDTLNADGLKITFVSVEDFTGYDSYDGPKSGNKIIVLTIDCENTSTSDKFVSCYDFECYADNQAADAYYWGDDDLSATLSAGRKTTGKVYFEVPENAESIEVEYETDFWSDEKAIFVVK